MRDMKSKKVMFGKSQSAGKPTVVSPNHAIKGNPSIRREVIRLRMKELRG